MLAVRDLDVTLTRDGRPSRVVNQISFDVAPGEIVALVGESGSGKSTIGRAIQGLLPMESQPKVAGSIRLGGVEIVGARELELRVARRSLVRSVPQDPLGSLDPTMKIGRQMVEPGGDRATILQWLARTGLADPERIADAYPHRLSGGQRQRVLIAMAMIAGPRLLIADEPTTALDVLTQAQVLDLVRGLSGELGTAILLVTHDLAVAASLAHRIVVLEQGRIVETGAVPQVVQAPAQPYTRGLLASRFDLRSDRQRPLPVAGWLPAEPWSPPKIEDAFALRLAGVSKSFAAGRRPRGGRPRPAILRSIDLAIRVGECVALVGESGAGKSTILRIAAGLLQPDSGEVSRIDDVPPQVVFQDPVSSLTPWLTVGEQIAEPLRHLAPRTRDARLSEALRLVGLDAELLSALPAELSVGQCQRAVLARAIAVPPRLLLCDEPVSALDVSLSASILNLLGDLRRRLGMAILFVTHDIAAARIIADRIAVLKEGELIEEGDAVTLTTAPTTPYSRTLIAAVPSLAGVQ